MQKRGIIHLDEPICLVSSVSEEHIENSAASIPTSLLEEQNRQRSSIVFNIDEDDYLVCNLTLKTFCWQY